MFARRVGDGYATKHACDFFDSVGALQVADAGLSPFAIALLAHLQMLGAKGRYLRKVSNAKHLCATRERGEFTADDLGNGATDPGIHFVKNHAGSGGLVARGTCSESDLHGQ
ncbi:MAG: hypothetical protein EBV65_09020 [Gammaproteobacteria bacterium]|nr:hypothetical protein [Gammaproteobacteria bacterium]